MSDNINPQTNLDYIRDLLSPYLDGEVNDEEQALVEQAVAASTELRQELESLRQMVALVRSLPPMAAPRPFTLAEADIQPVLPPTKRSFWFSLPAWAPGLIVATAAILCVLVGGGLLLGNFNRSAQVAMAPAPESATMPTTGGPEAAEAGLAAAEAPQPVEEAEAAKVAPPTPTAVAPNKEAAPTGQMTTTEAVHEDVLEKETEKPVSAESQQALGESEKGVEEKTEESIGEEGQLAASDSATASLAAPAAQPAPTQVPAITATPTPEAAVAEMAREAAPETPLSETVDSTAAQPAAPAPPVEAEAQAEQALELRPEATARLVEIEDQQVQVQPGLIQIEGSIEAPPGTTLVASLRRNQQPFDEWADPASLRTVVQPDRRFSFEIRAQGGRVDRDLFAVEAASYQVAISSEGVESSLEATVSFDTTAPALFRAQEATPTITPIPLPSPTPTPSNTPAPTPEPTLPAAKEAASAGSTEFFESWVLVLLALLVIVGVVTWLKLGRKK